MPDHLLDPALDPDSLLAKLDDLERQRGERPADARLSALWRPRTGRRSSNWGSPCVPV